MRYGVRGRRAKDEPTLDEKLKKRDKIAREMHVCRNCRNSKLDETLGEYKCLYYKRKPTYVEQEIKCEGFRRK